MCCTTFKRFMNEQKMIKKTFLHNLENINVRIGNLKFMFM